MQLTPRYGTDPVLTLDGSPADICGPAVRQRRRLAATLATFTEEQWSHPSRCAGWTNRDVIVHLDSTNAFWSFSIASGVGGAPTQFLATFDPVASPAALVDGAADVSSSEVLTKFTASTEAFAEQLVALDTDGWSALAEAPPGHISVSALVHHALWDSWVHERDILLPLGIAPAVEDDEVAACLRYGAALGPALARTRGDVRTGTLALEVTDPGVAAVIDIGDRIVVSSGTGSADLQFTGDAVELLEAFSIRRPFPHVVDPSHTWMLGGLSETFDNPVG